MSDIRILHGNALRLLLDLETASVDALITDPPYSSGGMMRSDRTLGVHAKYVTSGSGSKDLVGFSGDNRDARSYGYWASLWLTEALRVVKPGGVCILFTDWRQLPTTTDALQAGGWVWRGIVPWAKPNARPQQGRFSAQCEYAVWGTNGPRKLAGDCLPGFFEADPPRSRDHVTQKTARRDAATRPHRAPEWPRTRSVCRPWYHRRGVSVGGALLHRVRDRTRISRT